MHCNVYFILVRPVFLGNIGATARVLKNFGFSKLRLVAPPKQYKDAEARKMAVAAFDVLKNAELFDSLPAALADITHSIGTTSGQQRDLQPLPLHQLMPSFAQASDANRTAIVFGDERNGLAREELLRCHQIATIPTAPSFPALNIVQAVAIAAYEASRVLAAAPESNGDSHPTGSEDDELFQQLDSLLQSAQFSRTFNRTKVIAELRSFYQRAHPTTREASLLKGALIRLNARLTDN